MRSNKLMVARIMEVKELKRQKKELEDRIAELENSLKDEMKTRGTNELVLDGWTLRLTETSTNKFDTKAFKADFDKLYEQYCNQTVGTRFYILKEGK